ncbi:sugar-binding transcriptional regulator [Listeria booriae]|uniref:sugar-binding transcriptional regulator n=1 Tax=Listeria booriae TaxID=1552123 RepID=UPI00162731CC|nr:sugar-binding transcriptional regulator [Listeria booriae]MBC1335108.1 sugar-binding transcriptional regulator [Listeria booriae]MBC1946258.1 sugar-binding transcriptional regulator [Listeria booriae]MBC6163067.1 sugar-binding transcriptional regulator [Listeria booriae]
MDKQKQQLSIEVARLYYQSDYSQQEIASQLGISRPTVSRLLQFAKESGFVEIKVTDPFADLNALETALKAKYNLREAHVVFSPTTEYPTITDFLSKKAAEYLEETVTNGDILGVSWGTTMYEIAKKMRPQNVRGVEVIQLKGGISHSNVNTYASETISLFAENFQTMPRHLPLPVIFDNATVKQMVEQDRHIHHIIEMGKQANIAVFTVGTVRDEALLFRLGYFTEEEKALLKENGVGDICSRFYDKDGNICSTEIDARTIGIELDSLKQKEHSILVAGGARKVAAIHGALQGEYANVLITDQFTAKELAQV